MLFPTSAAAFRPSPDQILYSYSLPDGTPVCVVMNHGNTRAVPADVPGGWTLVPDPQPIALDCRNGNIIAEEHVPVRPEPTPEPAPEPEVSEEDKKRETCRQVREGAREGALEGWGPGMAVLDAEILSAFACAIIML